MFSTVKSAAERWAAQTSAPQRSRVLDAKQTALTLPDMDSLLCTDERSNLVHSAGGLVLSSQMEGRSCSD